MRHKFHKWFWVWNYDKEEKWLNKMAAEGLHLVAVGFCTYTFEEGIPGEYCMRMELLNNVPSHRESKQYISFVEDTGAEYIGSVARWSYFRKQTKKGCFNLFSDIDSKIKHLKRVLLLIGIVGAMEIYLGALNSILAFMNSSSPLNLFAAILCSLFGIIIAYGFLRLFIKFTKLKKERLLHE